MIPTPAYLMNGMAETSATTMQVQTGVCRLGDTLASGLENGNWLSRAMPKQSRSGAARSEREPTQIAARIERQQTKIAAETTNRYSVANPVEKFASMICAGP